MPTQFHMPRFQPYFMPADMEESAPGPGAKHSRMVAMKKVSQVARVMGDFRGKMENTNAGAVYGPFVLGEARQC